jgi:hypothetical protein
VFLAQAASAAGTSGRVTDMAPLVAVIAIAGGVALLIYAVKVTKERPSDLPLMEILGALGLLVIGLAVLIGG